MTELSSNQPEVDIEKYLEVLLFVAPGPVTITQLAQSLGKSSEDIEGALNRLSAYYDTRGTLSVQRHMGRIQLTTSSTMAVVIEQFLGLDASSHLSRAALECLAVIAYQQPVTRPQIDSVRGVNSDGVIKSLLNKGLIQEIGRAEGPGRPIMYGCTTEFLQYFGLNSISELPPLQAPEEAVSEEPTDQQLLKD